MREQDAKKIRYNSAQNLIAMTAYRIKFEKEFNIRVYFVIYKVKLLRG